jgi:hypothetical protein
LTWPARRTAAAWSITALLGIDKCCAPASLTVFAHQLEVSRNPAHVSIEPQATGYLRRYTD